MFTVEDVLKVLNPANETPESGSLAHKLERFSPGTPVLINSIEECLLKTTAQMIDGQVVLN